MTGRWTSTATSPGALTCWHAWTAAASPALAGAPVAEPRMTVPVYRMNPAEDEIRFGEEITEGMWVLADSPIFRSPHGGGEDEKIRAQRFRRVTRLRREPASSINPDSLIIFVGERSEERRVGKECRSR